MLISIEEELRRMSAMLRVLMQRDRPTISFAEVKELLEVKSNNSVSVWLAHNGIKPVTKGRYPRTQVTDAISNPRAAKQPVTR